MGDPWALRRRRPVRRMGDGRWEIHEYSEGTWRRSPSAIASEFYLQVSLNMLKSLKFIWIVHCIDCSIHVTWKFNGLLSYKAISNNICKYGNTELQKKLLRFPACMQNMVNIYNFPLFFLLIPNIFLSCMNAVIIVMTLFAIIQIKI